MSPAPVGLHDVGRRIGGQPEEPVAREHRRPVLPLLGDHDPRPEPERRAAGADEVRLVRELLELAVVEHQAVHRGERAAQGRLRDLDPQVHRVHGHEAGARALLAHLPLQVGLDVGQEQDVGVARRRGQLGLEVLEHVEVRVRVSRRLMSRW